MSRPTLRSAIGTLLPLATLVALLSAPRAAPAFAQQGRQAGGGMSAAGTGGDDGTCGWCTVTSDSVYQMNNPTEPESWGWVYFSMHSFPRGGDECYYPKPSGASCARCGSEAAPCHADLQDPAYCHIECGGDEIARAGAALEEAIAKRDARSVAAMLRAPHQKFATTYLAAGGRITIDATCDQRVPARQYPVPVVLRDELQRLLTE